MSENKKTPASKASVDNFKYGIRKYGIPRKVYVDNVVDVKANTNVTRITTRKITRRNCNGEWWNIGKTVIILGQEGNQLSEEKAKEFLTEEGFDLKNINIDEIFNYCGGNALDRPTVIKK